MIRALMLVLALSVLSCAAGADVTLRASDSVYPISFSQSIVDEQGAVYQPGDDEIVGHFKRSWRHWDWIYGYVSLSRHVDLGKLVAAEIERRQGDAVVNLSVRGSFWKTWYLTSLFIVIPESVGITVEGDIVRRRRDAP